MPLPFFTAALAAWRAAYTDMPVASAPAVAADAIVKLSIKAVANARTADTLGAEREGTGIVIDAKRGLILTIGYLVLESASILVMTRDARIYPASVAGFDHASGFGLVRALSGLSSAAVELGDSGALRELATVSVAAHGGAGGISTAAVVARRRFTGCWEYMIEDALFTAPPRYEHSGAALLDPAGKLVGIASLWVSDALEIGAAFPGNMFVPTDLLKTLLEDLVANGRRRGPARPWLGLYSEQQDGHLFVSRTLPDSPAAKAGLKRGDVILGVAGQSIGGQSDFYRKLWAAGEAGCDVTLHVLHEKAVKQIVVRTADRMDYLRPWRVASG
ncbi:MAG: S1C family serine protease [Burkholderiales bacterium]